MLVLFLVAITQGLVESMSMTEYDLVDLDQIPAYSGAPYVEGMLPFENMVAEHIRENEHHVLYRVSPIFQDEELVCRGVQMEDYCVECSNAAETDDEKFMFNVICYNVQPGVIINYATGESSAE